MAIEKTLKICYSKRITTHKHHHRHFVAGPVLALVIGVSVLQGGHSVASQAADSFGGIVTDEGTVVQITNGLDALVYSGRGFEGTALQNGSALIRTTGASSISAGLNMITAVSGVYHITYQNDALTIAALSTPVHVQTEDEEIVVPAGTQWRLDQKLTSIPQRFVLRQRENISLLPVQDLSALLPPARTAAPFPKWMRLSSSAWEQEVLGTLRSAVEREDTIAVESILQNEIRATRTVSILLESLQTHSSMTVVLLQELLQSERLWLLYGLHPEWRDAAWSIPVQASQQSTTLRIAALPESDVLPDSISVRTIPYWVETVDDYSRSLADPLPYLEELVKNVSKRVHIAESHGYPERALRWARALLDLQGALSINLPEGTQEKITALQSIGRIDSSAPIVLPEPEPIAEEELAEIIDVTEEAVVTEAYSKELVESRTLSVLADMGALFTVETVVIAVAPNTAQIRDVLFSTTTEDYTFDFVYNVVTGEIRDIIRNSKEYPYALSVEAFTRWIGR